MIYELKRCGYNVANVVDEILDNPSYGVLVPSIKELLSMIKEFEVENEDIEDFEYPFHGYDVYGDKDIVDLATKLLRYKIEDTLLYMGDEARLTLLNNYLDRESFGKIVLLNDYVDECMEGITPREIFDLAVSMELSYGWECQCLYVDTNDVYLDAKPLSDHFYVYENDLIEDIIKNGLEE